MKRILLILTTEGEDTPRCHPDREKERYEAAYGPHFSPKLADYAVSRLRNITDTSHRLSRDRIREHLRMMGLSDPSPFEDFYVLCNEVYSDYFPEPIKTEADVIRGAYRYFSDDPDGYEGALFYRFVDDARRKKDPIEWKHYL